MRTVRQLLESKSPDIHSISPDVPVIDAIRLMAEKGVGAVLVMQGEALVGILSERDYARKIVLAGLSSKQTPVRDIMTSKLITVSPDDDAQTCMQTVTRNRIRHLPVVENGRVQGVISIGDLLAAVIEQQQHELDQLQRYITG
ncbi:MAG: CBS domain-containing protein [Chiayiivirga sp.]|jgi:CBS domain-containing protein|uniref:CBS domain-containing protein n=1 Tax=Denitratimonas tolerans TaxID=1338420 RepID=A0AAW9R1U0_9GAMM|nr:CBS domain-containing protein [Chiayiivirga sp.]HMN35744.1 CBS domain-containing protein [Chiayiivirga sp.]